MFENGAIQTFRILYTPVDNILKSVHPLVDKLKIMHELIAARTCTKRMYTVHIAVKIIYEISMPYGKSVCMDVIKQTRKLTCKPTINSKDIILMTHILLLLTFFLIRR